MSATRRISSEKRRSRYLTLQTALSMFGLAKMSMPWRQEEGDLEQGLPRGAATEAGKRRNLKKCVRAASVEKLTRINKCAI